ncbi:MAG: hypothetical protein ABI333_18545 [bacterium]
MSAQANSQTQAVNVMYHDVTVASGVPMGDRDEAGGFVEAPEPLPVGTRVVLELLEGGDEETPAVMTGRLLAEVVGVREDTGKATESGMRVKFLDELEFEAPRAVVKPPPPPEPAVQSEPEAPPEGEADAQAEPEVEPEPEPAPESEAEAEPEPEPEPEAEAEPESESESEAEAAGEVEVAGVIDSSSAEVDGYASASGEIGTSGSVEVDGNASASGEIRASGSVEVDGYASVSGEIGATSDYGAAQGVVSDAALAGDTVQTELPVESEDAAESSEEASRGGGKKKKKRKKKARKKDSE